MQLNLIDPDAPEKFFKMMEINEAREWAYAGGIAIHRNFNVDGMTIGGKVRNRPAFHVLGLEPQILKWAKKHHLNPAWLQPAKDRFPPHFDVFGALGRSLEQKMLREREDALDDD